MNRLNTTNLNARRRGSVLLLVVAVLLLVFILGLMFMEIARLDRASTVNFTAAQDLEMVFNVTVSKIESQIKDDLGIVDNAASPSTPTPGDATDDVLFADGKQETYDYPGDLDRWLASFEPYDQATGLTRQASSIDETMRYSNVRPDADADGDGLFDSIWQPAPIPIFNGISYRVAVRTIDLSSMVNLNVATSQVDASTGAYDTNSDAAATEASRWLNPCDIDAGGMMFRFRTLTSPPLPAAAPTAMTQIKDLLDARMTADYGMPTQAAARESYWINVVSMNYPTGYYKADPSTEQFPISYRNGLHKSDFSTTLAREYLYNIFRYASTASATIPEVSESIYSDVKTSTDLPTYYQNNAKLFFTTISGANIYAQPFNSDVVATADSYNRPVVKRDINNLTPDELRQKILDVLNLGTFTLPQGMNNDQFAAQFAANLTDYMDTDSELTKVNDGTVDRYGFEALPVISEVYAQRFYKINSATETAAGSGIWTVTWQQQGDAGYAVEIRNPFRKPADIESVYLHVGGVPWGKLSALMGGQTTLAPDEVAVIYRDSSGGTTDAIGPAGDATGLMPAPLAENPGTLVTEPATANWPGAGATATAPITAELRATADDGTSTELSWSYWKVEGAENMPDSLDESGYASATDPSTLNITGYRQTSAIGASNGLNLLTVLPSEYLASSTASPLAARDTGLDMLGESLKPGGAAGHIPAAAATQEQLVILDDPGDATYTDGKMTHVGDLALIAAIPMDGTKTISEAWNGATTADGFRLNFASTELVDVDDLAVSFPVLLMNRLTTLSPLEDGLGTADLFLPGTLNINTADRETLLYALPLPGTQAEKEAMIDAILAYRDYDPDDANTERPNIADWRTNQGIAFLGELMNLDQMPTKTMPFMTDGMDTRLMNSTVVDFLSNPDDTNGDGIIDDREEKTMIGRWLAQVCSTRSDVFLTYLRVQGVNPTDNTIMNEKRVMILFDRSKVLGAADSVSVTQQAN
ncbi:hypothetical protein HED60_17210 [Planctomycetales bacterium ZRK34]|nr:hypothetical protein HED60_17210 [Planctomycetales bacterium ZRK34]